MKKTHLLLSAIALGAFVLFFASNSDIVPTRSFRIFWDLGHIAFFAIAIFLLLEHSSALQQTTTARRVVWVIGLCLVAGIIIESIQSMVGRQPDWRDLLRNILGGLTALVLLSHPKPGRNRLTATACKTVIIALLGWQLYPLLVTLFDEHRARQSFPMLADFETQLELGRWTPAERMTQDKQFSTHGDYSARVRLTPGRYAGASIKHFPSDWTGFDRLSFSIYLPDGPPLTITTRIHDRQHEQGDYLYSDRFHQTNKLQAGWNAIVIELAEVIAAPATRPMDREAIVNILVFTSNLKQTRVIYLDYLRLE